nr:peptide-methionine (S)-S-oxide reductase MsrA [Candidatus Sigynarchaeum springense]
METAIFAAGCFWGVEESFRTKKGVIDTVVGYTGGHVDLSRLKDPYKLVCTDKTGHAEAVQVTFDPKQVSYEELVDFFFHIHDPTQLNRQGPDVGSQYRSVIFFRDRKQHDIAHAVKERWETSGKIPGRIVTEIAPVSTFYPAEEYHQKYFKKNGSHGCLTYIDWETKQ